MKPESDRLQFLDEMVLYGLDASRTKLNVLFEAPDILDRLWATECSGSSNMVEYVE